MKIVTRSSLGRLMLAKLFRVNPLSVVFRYEKYTYDNDVTQLGFLNQVRSEFNEQAKKFNKQIDKEMEELVKDIT